MEDRLKETAKINKPTVSFDDVIRVKEAAKKMGCTVETLLKQAINEERLLYVAIAPHSSNLIAIPSQKHRLVASHKTKQYMIVPMLSYYAEALAISGKAEIVKYEAALKPPYDWHYWVLDDSQTIGLDEVFVLLSEKESVNVTDMEISSIKSLGIDLKITADNLFTNPPRNSELFIFVKPQVNKYINGNIKLPTKIQLWEYLKKNFPRGKTKDSIYISELNKDWDKEAFEKCFIRWTKPGQI